MTAPLSKEPTMVDLAELKGLLERATPGPWRAAGFEINASTSYGEDIYLRASRLFGAGGEANAEIVAALRNAAPDLIAELEAAREFYRILFPEPVKQQQAGYFVDSEVIGNLEGALIDLERQGSDAVCIATIKRVIHQLVVARETYDAATKSGGGNADR